MENKYLYEQYLICKERGFDILNRNLKDILVKKAK